jgi:hypothetical protein
MKRHRSVIFILLLTIFVTSCSGLPGNTPPTLIPEDIIPTVLELTAQALIDEGLVTPPPTLTLDPAQLTGTAAPSSTITNTPEPSLTFTPTLDVILATPEPLTLPDPLPQAEIQIINPGRLSRVISPLKLHLYLAPANSEKGEEFSYQISLYDENGAGLIQEFFIPEDNDSYHHVMDIDFNISGGAVSSRLEIMSRDGSGRISEITTTDLVLLSEGDEEIKAIQDLFDDLIIQQPISSTLVQGDVLIIQGLTRFAPDDQLIVELVDKDGGQVGSGIIDVSEDELGYGYRPFDGEIPFQVGSSAWIRVQVIAKDGNFSGIQYLSSVEVLVSP